MTFALLLLTVALSGPVEDSDAEREAAIRRAREVLSAELGVGEEDLALAEATAVVWRDSSLGCPQKGHVYTPSLTAGHRVVLEHEGRPYTMHVGASRAIRCDRVSGRPEGVKDDQAAATARLVDEARRDLAGRLGLPEDEIKLAALRRTTWPDRSLGCPEPGQTYAQARTSGFVIELEAGGGRHRYHTDRRRALYCPEGPGP